jgi:integrase
LPPGSPFSVHTGTQRYYRKYPPKHFVYFGKVADGHDAALAKWEAAGKHEGIIVALREGRDPFDAQRRQNEAEGPILADVVNSYVHYQTQQLERGKIKKPTLVDVFRTCKRLVDYFGRSRVVSSLTPDDWRGFYNLLQKTRGTVAIRNAVIRTRGVFIFALANEDIETLPRYGKQFDPPDQDDIDREKDGKRVPLFTSEEIGKLLAAASVPMRAMLLLGLNAAFGPSDLATLPIAAIDLEAGWVAHKRPKTGTPRRCPLWPSTIAAVREVLASRPAPRVDEARELLFVSKRGLPWCRVDFKLDASDKLVSSFSNNEVSKVFARLLRKAGVAKLARRSFYSLRHKSRSLMTAAKDEVAADFVCGHVLSGMRRIYIHREEIADARLRHVVDSVHQQLWGTSAWPTPAEGGAA